MPFDTLAMAAITDELRPAIGSQIQRIIQPSASTVSIGAYGGGAQRWIVLSADPRYGRVHVGTGRLAKGFATPSRFIMLLRKHLEGARILDVFQQPYERVLHLVCGSSDRMTELVAEVMGKHSNLILVQDGCVLGALKIVGPRQSRVRPVLPHRPYLAPPVRHRDEGLYGSGERLDPFIDRTQVLTLLQAVPADVELTTALQGLLPGASPFVTAQIVLRAGYPEDARLGAVALESVLDAAAYIYGLYETRAWEPCRFRDRNERCDFAPFIPLGVRDQELPDSLSAAVESCLGREETRDVLVVARKSLLDQTARALSTARRRVESLKQGLEASGRAEEIKYQGQLVLAYAYRIEPRSTELVIPELKTSINLDPDRTPAENAERLFRRYRKLRDAQNKIPSLLAAAETEVARLEDVAVFATLATSEAELRDLQRSLEPESLPESSKPRKKRAPLRFEFGAFTALVGRNARENEELTFRLAHRDDAWLHARQRTGAHVVLSGDSRPPDDVLEAAAELAAFFSEGRSDTRVDVDIVPVRDVRKIPAGPPGRVLYRNERTIRVEPRVDRWLAKPSA